MGLIVRPARRSDDAAALLYQSAAPYYDAYAGNRHRAQRLLSHVFARAGHTASWEVCQVAELGGEIVGVLAGFPARDGDRLARRFLALTLVRMPAWRWPMVLRHLRAAAALSPEPPPGAFYIDALAVSEPARRRGVARALLARAEALAAEHGASGVALDTGVENGAAQAFYAACGYERRGERRAHDARAQRAVGGAGFVAFFKDREG